MSESDIPAALREALDAPPGDRFAVDSVLREVADCTCDGIGTTCFFNLSEDDQRDVKLVAAIDVIIRLLKADRARAMAAALRWGYRAVCRDNPPPWHLLEEAITALDREANDG